MQMRYLLALGASLALLAVFASPAQANELTAFIVTPTCTGYSISITVSDLSPSDAPAVVDYQVTFLNSGLQTVNGTIPVNTSNPTFTTNLVSQPYPNGSFTGTVDLLTTGNAELMDSEGDEGGIPLFGQNNTLSCSSSSGPPPGKTFSIGPSSMEGDLHIHPGDWISGGYNFKFVSGNHAATSYSVTATVTLPVTCPDNSLQNIVVILGAPGQLNGGGVSTYTYSIPANDTKNHATGDQNSILAWEGATQAPATLCGGQVGRNQSGAIFSATVSQNPPSGSLVDWQFHYRDPAAKNNPNTNCTDATDPNRNSAAVCGASWSQTVRDP